MAAVGEVIEWVETGIAKGQRIIGAEEHRG
jgi:hypothetical protein